MSSSVLTPTDAGRLEACLSGDGVAVIPTDTVYGLACNPASERAVERLYELKGRPPRKPSAVMFFSLEAALQALPELGPRTRAAVEALLPGPLTLLLPNPNSSFPLASGAAGDERLSAADEAQSLGVRVPLFQGPLAALAEVSAPALQSSANLSGGLDPRRLADVPLNLREDADVVLDGGGLRGTASTVVDLSRYDQNGMWQIVRDGPVSPSTLKRILG